MNPNLLKKVMLASKQAFYIFILQVMAMQLLLAGESVSQRLNATEIDVAITNQSLVSIFGEIEKQTPFEFGYTQKVINDHRKFTFHSTDNLYGLLEEIAIKLGYNFKRINEIIYVIPRSKQQSVEISEEIVDKTIQGKVKDAETDEALVGATVLVKNTQIGTVTDVEGNFKLSIPDDETTLVISYVGYESKEIIIDDETNFMISLDAGSEALDEVVIVGYGTQEKINLTGAVEEISSKTIEDRPITNIGQSLQGLVPNLNITYNDGSPGSSPNFNIRGITSINGGGPLILIDGIPGDPTLINPRDIESVTVLKDAASSAVYGARGAYGVILINTKKPKNQAPKLSYSGNYSVNTPTILPEAITDPYAGMKMINDARAAWDGGSYASEEAELYALERSMDPSLPEAKIISTTAGDSYLYAAGTDWIDAMYDKYQPMQQHTLSLSGGSGDVSYYLSGGFLDQQGVFKNDADKFTRYNLRGKVNIKVNKWLSLNNNLMYNRGIQDFPAFWGNTVDIWRYIAVGAYSYFPITNPDGSWTTGGRFVAYLEDDAGKSVRKENLIQNTIGAELKFLDNRLTVVGNYTFQNDGYRKNDRIKQVEYSTTPGVVSLFGANRVQESSTDNYYSVINAYATFEDEKGKHYFKNTIGYNQEYRAYNYNYVQREGIISDELSAIGLGVGDIQVASDAYEWAIRGAFFRANYIFNDKYLVELNGRYDGSSRFPSADRYGFFPSASVGWRISEEQFFNPVSQVVSNMKLRASIGSLGNQNLPNNYYPYIPTMSSSVSGVIINNERPLVIDAPGAISTSLTWETATTWDIGAEMGFFNNRLSLVYDYYVRETANMLTKSKTLPSVFGTAEPLENAADLKTKGWELSVSWRDAFNLGGSEFNYNLRFILSDYTSEITRFDNPNDFLGDYYVGQKVGEIWGFNTEGFFQNEGEIEAHADQTELMRQPGNIQPGDLKFEDTNNDGFITYGENTLADPGDRSVIGNSEPRYSFGFNSFFEWKGFNLSFIIQGVAKRDYYPGREASYFWSVYNRPYNTPLKHIEGNTWTPDNRDAYFPRLKGYIALAADKELDARQTRYLQDASYMRLKNLTLGYSFKNSLIKRAGFDKVRIYVSGENLWETTGLIMPVDPESLYTGHSWGDGSTYPFSRTYSIGLDITL